MAAPAPDDLLAGDCRICLGEGWYSPAPRAGIAAHPAAGGQQQRAPSVGPPRAAPGACPRPTSGEVAADAAAQLIAPCKCQGTVRYVHKDCLLPWLRREAELCRPLQCGACLTAFCVVTQRRGLLTSRAPLAVKFRQSTMVHWGIVAAITAAVSVSRGCGISWASIAAYCLLAVILCLGSVWAFSEAARIQEQVLEQMFTLPAPESFADLSELGAAFVFNGGFLFHYAGLAALNAARIWQQLYPDPGGSFLLLAGNSTARAVISLAELARSHVAPRARSEDARMEGIWVLSWMAAVFVASIVHAVVTRRARYLQPVLQVIMAMHLIFLFHPYPLVLVGLLCSSICTLLNAAALWVDLRTHGHEHAPVLDVQEPPAAQPQGAG
eukprot:TRINITY_DN23598_c0_g1_i2.p1 TRINITY_DN23598_c0_g1~~TRINITY_DN23598_c0_g1_i2.p1  ORF type:complete len:408 (+),score=68.73 TRINITY_DN23598_c0_g1_i2:80-1225(+)